MLRTWRGGPQAGQPRVPSVAQRLLDRKLMRLDTTQHMPRQFFTEAGLGVARNDGRSTPRGSGKVRPSATGTWPGIGPRARRLTTGIRSSVRFRPSRGDLPAPAGAFGPEDASTALSSPHPPGSGGDRLRHDGVDRHHPAFTARIPSRASVPASASSVWCVSSGARSDRRTHQGGIERGARLRPHRAQFPVCAPRASDPEAIRKLRVSRDGIHIVPS